MVMKTVLNIKTDPEVKLGAQKVALGLGFPLSTIVNAYLKNFVRTKEIYFSLELNPKPALKRLLKRVERDIHDKKNLSPVFDNADDAIRYLKGLQ